MADRPGEEEETRLSPLLMFTVASSPGGAWEGGLWPQEKVGRPDRARLGVMAWGLRVRHL